MRVAFNLGSMSFKGPDLGVYKYAKFNKEILGNESIILCSKDSEMTIKDKFDKEFEVRLYKETEDNRFLEDLIKDQDVLYIHHRGKRTTRLPRNIKVCIHCETAAETICGDVCAATSYTSAGSTGIPIVPYIVWLPEVKEDLREILAIPDNAVVLGWHGSPGNFNLPTLKIAMSDVLFINKNIYFVIIDKTRALRHNRVIYLEPTTDDYFISAFINTCDAMIHGKAAGESFGISVGEFSLKNKPVITYAYYISDGEHLRILGDQAIKWTDRDNLVSAILNIKRNHEGQFDAYKQFSPDKVMKQFDEVFLNG